MVKKQTSTKKIKKKKWFPVVSPKLFGGKVLGESLLSESSTMKGRFMNINLMNLVGDPKKQNTNIQLYIKDVREGQGITEIVKIERINSFMKRLVRRGRKKIEDSFIAKTKEGKRTRVKTIIISNSIISKLVASKIRLSARQILKDKIKKESFEKTVDDILKGSILKELKNELSKIAPVRNFDIRVFKLESKKLDEANEVEVSTEESSEEVVSEKENKEEKKPKKESKKEEETEKEDSKEEKTSTKKKEKDSE